MWICFFNQWAPRGNTSTIASSNMIKYLQINPLQPDGYIHTSMNWVIIGSGNGCINADFILSRLYFPMAQWVNIWFMPPPHCRECCLRTNTNWHSLRIAQHRIDSNYFVLVRCHFRISSQANTNVLKCSKHSYWPCESILFVLRRIASPNVVSIRVSSYWFVSHRCTFVSIRCTFALGFAACLVLDRTCSHWFV